MQFSSTAIYINTPFNATASINYSGGNGVAYASGAAISSTGVTGLTAVLQPGVLTNNTGSLTFTIQGTPVSTGCATFPINFGGQACSISIKVDSANQVNTNTGFDFLIAPNPVNANTLTIIMYPSSTTIYYAWVYDELGRTVYMWPVPSALTGAGMMISSLPKGTYVLKIMDEANKDVVSKKFIKK